MPARFEDQLAVVQELRAEVARMERGEKRRSTRGAPRGYERELRLAGLAQRIAQAYTVIEGVLAFIARRIDRVPLSGGDWHKELILRCARPFEHPARPAVLPAALSEDLLELCEFRHVVRNIYPTRLEESKVRENFDRLGRAVRAFDAACNAFAAQAIAPRKPPRIRHDRRG